MYNYLNTYNKNIKLFKIKLLLMELTLIQTQTD